MVIHTEVGLQPVLAATPELELQTIVGEGAEAMLTRGLEWRQPDWWWPL